MTDCMHIWQRQKWEFVVLRRSVQRLSLGQYLVEGASLCLFGWCHLQVLCDIRNRWLPSLVALIGATRATLCGSIDEETRRAVPCPSASREPTLILGPHSKVHCFQKLCAVTVRILGHV